MYYKNEHEMILLASAGDQKQEEQIVEGKLIQKNNDILFQGKDFTIIFNYNVDNIFNNKLYEIAQGLNKLIYLYVDKDSYRQFFK